MSSVGFYTRKEWAAVEEREKKEREKKSRPRSDYELITAPNMRHTDNMEAYLITHFVGHYNSYTLNPDEQAKLRVMVDDENALWAWFCKGLLKSHPDFDDCVALRNTIQLKFVVSMLKAELQAIAAERAQQNRRRGRPPVLVRQQR